jgi:cobalt-precorrin 5A hydrolase
MAPGPVAIITLSEKGLAAARALSGPLGAKLFFPSALGGASSEDESPYDGKTAELLKNIYELFRGFIMIMPLGAAVRLVAPHLSSKVTDPAVVVVDVLGRWAIAALGGHEGGANNLALEVSNIIFSDAVITTSTEAEKDIIVGIGARKGVEAHHIVKAVVGSLKEMGISIERVRLIATAEVKSREEGILQASRDLGVPLKIIGMHQIADFPLPARESAVVRKHVGVGGVCEPAALLAGRNAVLIMQKKNFRTLSLAVARERCWSSE